MPSLTLATPGVACCPEPQTANFMPSEKGLRVLRICETSDAERGTRKHAGFSSRSSSENYDLVISSYCSLPGRAIRLLEMFLMASMASWTEDIVRQGDVGRGVETI